MDTGRDGTRWDRTHRRIVDTAAALIAERGLAGLTVADVVEATGLSRAQIYAHVRGTVEMAVAAGEAFLVSAPAVDAEHTRFLFEVEELVVARQRSTADLELALRAAAGSGVPRLREVIARLELLRHEEAKTIVRILGLGPLDERVHVVERLLTAEPWSHLVQRCGWPEDQYRRWFAVELIRLRGSRPPGYRDA